MAARDQNCCRSAGKGQGRRRVGRVSYQLLSINQLGAVYEALLSYRGFFAKKTCTKSNPPQEGRRQAQRMTTKTAGMKTTATKTLDTTCAKRAAIQTPTCWRTPGSCPAAASTHYKDDETISRRGGRQAQLRMHPKGQLHLPPGIGRDRQKSASYYTPGAHPVPGEVRPERTAGKRTRQTATTSPALTVCEPAMGSAAFLNEAVNQLAEAYLERKQAELKRRIPHEKYPQGCKRVRMYRRPQRVRRGLEPVAVELAEVSIWLNAIYGEQDEQGNPLPARVPWFGYQLFAGNSLIGARHQVFNAPP